MRRGTNWSLLLAGAMSVLLAASTLSRVYTNLSYLPELVAAIAVAFAAGWLSRRLDVPAVLAPAVSFVGLVEYLTLVYFREHAFGRVLPTTSVFRDAGEAVHTAMKDIRTLASPVVPTAELVMITVAGVFAVAVLVDLLIFRSRRPVTAGLALLSLFIIPASLSPTGAGWLNFSLAAAGYLALLTVEGRERVRRWGRRLAPDRAAADAMGDAVPLFRVARGIGAAAIGLALVVPGIVPGLDSGILSGTGGPFGSGGSGGGRGGGRSLLGNPVVNIRPSLRSNVVTEWLQVRTSGAPEYLRLAVLHEFNGAAWEMGYDPSKGRLQAKDRELPAPRGLVPPTPVERYSATIEATDEFDETWLPVPYSLSRLGGIGGKWYLHELTGSVYSPNKKVRGSDYDVEAIVARPDPNTVSPATIYPAEIQALATLRSGRVAEVVRQLAFELTEDQPTPWAKVIAIQDYFTSAGRFTYSLEPPPGTGNDAIVDFLESRIGYCEQFAGTMAVMVRAIGLPSRVVVGFTPGSFQGDYYSITNRDFHAWPEVYFPGTGWVRFEPTPATAGPGVTIPSHATAPPLAPRTRTPGATSTDATDGPGVGPSGPRLDREPPVFPQGPAVPISDHPSRLPLLLAGLLALLVLPTLPALTRMALRRRERARAPTDAELTHVAWHHLEDDANDLGFGWAASASPRTAARELIVAARLADGPADAVRRLARAEEIARYARQASSAEGLDRDVATVRAALLTAVSRRQRLMAMVLPRSTLRQVNEAVADGYVGLLGRWDRTVRALRRRVGLSRAGA